MSINPKLMTLVSLLADGRYYSGEQLGAAIEVSRAAVWKYLQQLDGLGLKLSSRKGLGYCLDVPLELLDRSLIRSRLNALALKELSDFQLLSVVDSTNQYLLDLSAKGQSISGVVVSSEKQSGGRGRRGRAWYSPFAKNLYLSVGWRFHNGINAIEGLSLAVGVAICRALAKLGITQAELKWPNDILLNEGKLGGVLIELSGDMSGDCDAVIGVGLNVHMSSGQENHNSDVIGQPWTSVVNTHFESESKEIDEASEGGMRLAMSLFSRNDLLSELMNELFSVLSSYEFERFVSYKSEFEGLHAYQGKEVCLISGDNVTSGIVVGVSDQGGLLLSIEGAAPCEFHGGEVSLRASP